MWGLERGLMRRQRMGIPTKKHMVRAVVDGKPCQVHLSDATFAQLMRMAEDIEIARKRYKALRQFKRYKKRWKK